MNPGLFPSTWIKDYEIGPTLNSGIPNFRCNTTNMSKVVWLHRGRGAHSTTLQIYMIFNSTRSVLYIKDNTAGCEISDVESLSFERTYRYRFVGQSIDILQSFVFFLRHFAFGFPFQYRATQYGIQSRRRIEPKTWHQRGRVLHEQDRAEKTITVRRLAIFPVNEFASETVSKDPGSLYENSRLPPSKYQEIYRTP